LTQSDLWKAEHTGAKEQSIAFKRLVLNTTAFWIASKFSTDILLAAKSRLIVDSVLLELMDGLTWTRLLTADSASNELKTTSWRVREYASEESPRGRRDTKRSFSDRDWRLIMLPVEELTYPKLKERGSSSSVQSEAERVNLSVSSRPSDGRVRKFPGIGFLAIDIVREVDDEPTRLAAVRVNVNTDPGGNKEPGRARLKGPEGGWMEPIRGVNAIERQNTQDGSSAHETFTECVDDTRP
jgi:hypothetical protein